MKSGKQIAIRFTIFITVIISISLGLWLWWQDGISAADQNDTAPVVFAVNRGEGIKSIVTRLSQQNLIRSPTAFYVLIKTMRLERQIQAGDFRLNRAMDAETITRQLTHGILDVWVTTLEGWRDEEIAAKLSKELDIPESEFLKIAQEGYMFPDTYLIPREATAGAVVEVFKKTFYSKITGEMMDEIKKQDLTLNDLVILASIVEREGKNSDDKPVISGILLNRLKVNHPLQVDATLQYALGYQPNEKSWWKQNLTQDDKDISSPYNTYKYAGLPPGPISNPGLDSIKAVIFPKLTDYFYYLHDVKGNVRYARTLEEHNANISQYLQ